MDIEGIVSLLAMLIFWRVLLCLSLTAFVAFWMVQAIPWMGGLQGLGFTLLGLIPALMWHERACGPGGPPAATSPTPVSVVLLGSFFASGTWGLFSAASGPAAAFGLIVLVLAALGWRLMASGGRRWQLPGSWPLRALFMAAGYLAGLWAGSEVLSSV